MIDQERLWNSRASLGKCSGTRDLIAVELERRAIERYVKDGMRVLDVGCGTGETLLRIASMHSDIYGIGIDAAPGMVIAAAENLMESAFTSDPMSMKGSRVGFAVGDVLTWGPGEQRFDLIATQRCLINLGTWERQQAAIRRMVSWLKPGGTLLMVECSEDGLASINALRRRVALPSIIPPNHNRYLRHAEMAELACKLLGYDSSEEKAITYASYPEPICSTYSLLSRVVNAKLAMDAGTEPQYDSAVNRLALELPNLGDLGQNRMWRWIKADKRPLRDWRIVAPDPLPPEDLD